MRCIRFGNDPDEPDAEMIVNTMPESLRELHDQYVDAINRAVAEDRDDLLPVLEDDYLDEAAALLTAA